MCRIKDYSVKFSVIMTKCDEMIFLTSFVT